jgi:hypothetical protein
MLPVRVKLPARKIVEILAVMVDAMVTRILILVPRIVLLVTHISARVWYPLEMEMAMLPLLEVLVSLVPTLLMFRTKDLS